MTLVTVSGFPGSGTTTLVGLLKAELGLPSYNVGDAFRSIAAERGLNLLELHEAARTDRSIDRALDEKQVEVARAGNVILEGRLAGFLTHQARVPGVRVWLQAPFAVRTARIAKREGIPLSRAEHEVRERETAERTRYRAFYGFDLDDTSVYDLVLDTGVLPAQETAQAVQRLVRGSEGDQLRRQAAV